MAKDNKTLRWVRLDNAAKIYPAVRRRNWSNVFRQSATLYECVDLDILKSALDVTVPRFPAIAARLRKGAFWYYLQEVEQAPKIKEEQSYPLCFMSKEEMRQCAFRVIVYRERIAVEFFHSLTDGNGALVFLKTLVAEYLEQKYHITIPCEHGILNRNEKPLPEELEDSFLKYAGKVAASRKETDAWRMPGVSEKDGFLHLTCFQVPVKESLEMAHQYNATLTVFLGAVMMKALVEMQKSKVPDVKRQKRIKLLIPVNLRKIFSSSTLRNFVLYSIPELDPRLGEYSLEEICRIIEHTMGLDNTPKHMSMMIATNVNDERNPFLRLVPLPLKNLVMKAVYDSVGERKTCMTFSNVGLVKLPDEMKQYVKRIDFILGVQATAPYNCGVVSYGDTVYMNFIRNIRDAELERHFYAILQEVGIPVTVESNQN